MLSPGPPASQVASVHPPPPKLVSDPAAQQQRGNNSRPLAPASPTPTASVLDGKELDDVRGSRAAAYTTDDEASSIRGSESITPEHHATPLNAIPDIPTISVSAVSATATAPPGPSSQQPPATSSWWKLGSGMALTGDSRGDSSARRRTSAGSWWSGAGAGAVDLGSSPPFSTPHSSRVPSTAGTTSSPPAGGAPAVPRQRRSLTAGPAAERSPSSTLSSLTSMLSRLTHQQPDHPEPDDDDDDELCTMNLEAALPAADDPHPHLKSLALLARFQTAYRAQARALVDMRAERSAERDEHALASARARHLQSRLDATLLRAEEHEAAMASILEELNAEKRARLDLELELEARRATAADDDGGKEHAGPRRLSPAPSGSEGSFVTEDLAAEEDQRRARSGPLQETDDESLFSRSRSSTLAESSGGGGGPSLFSPSPSPSPCHSPAAAGPSPHARHHHAVPRTPAPAPRRSLTAFQKIIRGMSPAEGGNGSHPAGGGGRCANCAGGDAAVAWDTVGLLRDENRGLKQRVVGLEAAVEGALDVVNGVGM